MNQFLTHSFVLAMAIAPIAHAEIYQCEENGKISYSQTACKTGSKETQRQFSVENNSNPGYGKIAEQLKKDKAESKQLTDKRHKEEVKYEKEVKQITLKAEKKKEKCDYLQMQVKWAAENLENASPKTQSQARTKLKRAKEKAEFFCK
ncbi:DUF4124 domain-containing protein [Undibacterium sp. SXout7W]|uniref:DUF4124 domain-containing protein n=1 Tax=Undibacterium sp. SXout7W TaxID=3413049 RepID=UPI003BF378F5